MDPVRQNPIWLTCKPLQRMCNNRMLHITTIKSSLLMFPLAPDQHHWLEVATEDEGWCSFTSCTPSRSRARTPNLWQLADTGTCKQWLISRDHIFWNSAGHFAKFHRPFCQIPRKIVPILRPVRTLTNFFQSVLLCALYRSIVQIIW